MNTGNNLLYLFLGMLLSLIVLPLVLGSSGLPPQVVTGVIPLIMPVDWLIGRARTGVNVMSDMVVAVMLDADEGPSVKVHQLAEPRNS